MNNGELFQPLSKFCDIRSGQTFKRPWEEYDFGHINVILPKDISDGNISNETIKLSENQIPGISKHLLKKGEVVILNKGTKFTSAVYQGHPEHAVVTTAFYVLTLSKNLLPEYLSWFLSQQEAKDYFSQNTRGSVIPGINKFVLENLPIPLIPLATQKKICDFAKAAKEEQTLISKLLEKKIEFTESYLWECIKSTKNEH